VPAWHRDPASPAQLSFIESLRRTKDDTGMGPTPANLDKLTASKAIEWLKKRGPKPVTPTPAPEPKGLELGFYEWDGHIYRVCESDRTGRMYVLELDLEHVTPGAKLNWLPQRITYPALSALEPESISLDTVRDIGAITLRCVFCGRDLTDDRSTAAGYGPVCSAKYNLPWG